MKNEDYARLKTKYKELKEKYKGKVKECEDSKKEVFKLLDDNNRLLKEYSMSLSTGKSKPVLSNYNSTNVKSNTTTNYPVHNLNKEFESSFKEMGSSFGVFNLSNTNNKNLYTPEAKKYTNETAINNTDKEDKENSMDVNEQLFLYDKINQSNTSKPDDYDEFNCLFNINKELLTSNYINTNEMKSSLEPTIFNQQFNNNSDLFDTPIDVREIPMNNTDNKTFSKTLQKNKYSKPVNLVIDTETINTTYENESRPKTNTSRSNTNINTGITNNNVYS